MTASDDRSWGVRHQGAAESPAEAAFLGAATAAGLRVVAQYEVFGGRYRLDFAIPSKLVGIEVDGLMYHNGQESFVRDRRRQRDLELAGWRVLRFAAVEVLDDPERCVDWVASYIKTVDSETTDRGPTHTVPIAAGPLPAAPLRRSAPTVVVPSDEKADWAWRGFMAFVIWCVVGPFVGLALLIFMNWRS